MRFDYKIEYIPGKENILADTLSRTPCNDETKVPQIHFIEPSLSLDSLKRETSFDTFLINLTRRIVSGDWLQDYK